MTLSYKHAAWYFANKLQLKWHRVVGDKGEDWGSAYDIVKKRKKKSLSWSASILAHLWIGPALILIKHMHDTRKIKLH